MKPFKWRLTAVVATALLSTVFGIVSPKIMGQATTELFKGFMTKQNGVAGTGIDFGYIGQIVLILIGLYLLSALFSYIQQYLMAGVAQNTVYALRKDVNDKLARSPLKFFDSRPHGEILSRVVNDVDSISTTLQQSLTQLLTSVITLLGIIVMMLTISPSLTLILVLTPPLSFLAIKAISSRSLTYFKGQQKALGELNGHVEEMYTGHKIVKAFGHETKSVAKFDGINEELYQAGWKAQFISGVMMPLMSFINNLGYVGICVVGVARHPGIDPNRRYPGVHPVCPAVFHADCADRANRERYPIDHRLRRAGVRAAGRRGGATGYHGGSRPYCAQRRVKFQNVKFGYKEDVTLIDNMNIDVKPGQTIAIVGPTGAGKTTLINLLMRFYEIGDGKITVDGADITRLKRGHLRSMFGMVLQDTWLFNGTIRDNIAYGREGATEEEIVQAAVAAHADHFIRTLPDGYNTVLNEEASNISQGQKQLLTIARAILANPAILILDEATSSVDTRTEIHVQHAMNELMKGRTSFVIAHRLSTIRSADLILVMNHGRVIEKGKHEELLAKGGFYADLYNSQFRGGARIEAV
ncbi:ABC transporter ATP-binding protein/permease [Paenibacillus sp. P25]|nr:ABC transporter ATP-binding protein/permease [Paenibacillus sp. P25]